MKQAVINSSYAFIYLNKQIYSKKAIEKALDDFKEFILPYQKEFRNYTTIKLEPKTKDFTTKELTDEFLNYLCGIEFQLGGASQ